MEGDKDFRMSLGPDDAVLPASTLQSNDDGAAMALETAPSPADKPFLFLNLPSEIRNAIYEYPAVYRTKPSRMDTKRGLVFTSLSQAPITCVNKQLRRETLPLFYRDHKFVLEVPKHPDEYLHYEASQGRYPSPLDHIWKKFRDFNPLLGHHLASNLQFLSHLTILLEIGSENIMRLGFTMSSKALVQDELAYGEWLVGTANMDWDDVVHIRAAYNNAIDSSELSQNPVTAGYRGGIRCLRADRAAVYLSSMMLFVSKHCPQLTRSVAAIIQPSVVIPNVFFRA